MKTKEGRDLPVSEITAETYLVPKGEELVVHAKIEVRQFDNKTGRRISVPRIQKFGVKEWNGCVFSSLRKQGYTIEILHDPTKWQQEKLAEIAALREAEAKAKAEAEAKAKADELARIKEEAKAELLEELKAQGLISEGKKEGKKDAKKEGKKDAKEEEQ